MAAVVGDFVSDLSRLHHSMIAKAPALQSTQQPHSQRRHHAAAASPRQVQAREESVLARSASRSRPKAPRSPRRGGADARHFDEAAIVGQDHSTSAADSHCPTAGESLARGALPIPSPPLSVVPSASASLPSARHPSASHATGASSSCSLMTPQCPVAAQSQLRQDMATSPGRPQQPSPPVDDFRIPFTTPLGAGCCALAAADADAQATPRPVIHVRDLAHLDALAAEANVLNGPSTKFEISAMPIGDVIEMVAALLTKITLTNDNQHDATQRNAAHQQQASQTTDAAQMSPLSHSVLAFHGKNVPTINIVSYLARIHKYCPTTYEVFLSLLVYFDRMTERVNDWMMRTEPSLSRPMSSQQLVAASDNTARLDEEAAGEVWQGSLRQQMSEYSQRNWRTDATTAQQGASIVSASEQSLAGPATYFVVDSYNIHRLVIAGVTCASKFFSDVFYTNSRYAKVGGLPLAELNHLEIQFLVLNDFRLAVTVEELEAYGTMLVEFYAREVITSKMGPREWSNADKSSDGR